MGAKQTPIPPHLVVVHNCRVAATAARELTDRCAAIVVCVGQSAEDELHVVTATTAPAAHVAAALRRLAETFEAGGLEFQDLGPAIPPAAN